MGKQTTVHTFAGDGVAGEETRAVVGNLEDWPGHFYRWEGERHQSKMMAVLMGAYGDSAPCNQKLTAVVATPSVIAFGQSCSSTWFSTMSPASPRILFPPATREVADTEIGTTPFLQTVDPVGTMNIRDRGKCTPHPRASCANPSCLS